MGLSRRQVERAACLVEAGLRKRHPCVDDRAYEAGGGDPKDSTPSAVSTSMCRCQASVKSGPYASYSQNMGGSTYPNRAPCGMRGRSMRGRSMRGRSMSGSLAGRRKDSPWRVAGGGPVGTKQHRRRPVSRRLRTIHVSALPSAPIRHRLRAKDQNTPATVFFIVVAWRFVLPSVPFRIGTQRCAIKSSWKGIAVPRQQHTTAHLLAACGGEAQPSHCGCRVRTSTGHMQGEWPSHCTSPKACPPLVVCSRFREVGPLLPQLWSH